MKYLFSVFLLCTILSSCSNRTQEETSSLNEHDKDLQDTYAIRYRVVIDGEASVDTIIFTDEYGVNDTVINMDIPWEKIIELNPDSASTCLLRVMCDIEDGKVSLFMDGSDGFNTFDKEDYKDYYSESGDSNYYTIDLSSKVKR
ncbi:MAG: hypothetical protein ACEPOV_11110 [Hyphomicrobiales bacterium]